MDTDKLGSGGDQTYYSYLEVETALALQTGDLGWRRIVKPHVIRRTTGFRSIAHGFLSTRPFPTSLMELVLSRRCLHWGQVVGRRCKYPGQQQCARNQRQCNSGGW